MKFGQDKVPDKLDKSQLAIDFTNKQKTNNSFLHTKMEIWMIIEPSHVGL